MTDIDIRALITAERQEMAAVLTGLSAQEWDTQTLCAGWRVREVVAHMTMQYRYSVPRVMIEVLKARGDFNRMADRCARRDAARMSSGELATTLRDNANHPWKPPVGGYVGALTHDVVHGLDITTPLGIDRRVPGDRLPLVLQGLSTPRGLKFFGVDLNGIELRAEDLDWSLGTGTPVSGAAQDLVLVLAGRKLPNGRLRGEFSERFTRG